MLNVEKIIENADRHYITMILDGMSEGGEEAMRQVSYLAPETLKIHSRQVKAVTKALVEALNSELEQLTSGS